MNITRFDTDIDRSSLGQDGFSHEFSNFSVLRTACFFFFFNKAGESMDILMS